jgi:hypothetical protein
VKKYSDAENAKGILIIFVLFQMILLALMYTIVYTTYRVTEQCVAKYDLNPIVAFAPTVIVFIATPLVLYKTRSIFRQGRMMEAIIWMMALLSIFLVGLMLHVNNISGLS